MKMIKTRRQLLQYEWIWYAQSYLSLARIGIEELKGRNYIRKIQNTTLANSDDAVVFIDDFSYNKKHLLIPIIYNLKHSIELIVKSLGVEIDGNFFSSHDTADLIDTLQSSIKESRLKIPKPEKLNELIGIAKKYHTLEFWSKKLVNTSSIYDSKNDVFRFPDTQVNLDLNLEILRDVSTKEIKELLDDIERLDSLFGILRYGIVSEKGNVQTAVS